MVEERLRNWIALQRKKGRTELEIYNLLQKNGYSEYDAGKALDETKKSSVDVELKQEKNKNSKNKKLIIFIIIWGIIFVAWLAWGYFTFFRN